MANIQKVTVRTRLYSSQCDAFSPVSIPLYLSFPGLEDFFALVRQLLVAVYFFHLVDELEPVFLLHVSVSVGMGDLESALAQLRVYRNSSASEVYYRR